VVIGGTTLMPDAIARQDQAHQSEQTLLAEAEYKPDEIWTRPSRVAVQAGIEQWYYGFMLCLLLAIVLADDGAQTGHPQLHVALHQASPLARHAQLH
jgi:hypothetical protein